MSFLTFELGCIGLILVTAIACYITGWILMTHLEKTDPIKAKNLGGICLSAFWRYGTSDRPGLFDYCKNWIKFLYFGEPISDNKVKMLRNLLNFYQILVFILLVLSIIF